MQQQHELNEHIEQFLQSLHEEESAEHEADMPQEEPQQRHTEQRAEEDIQETIHVYFVREQAAPQKDGRVIESTPPISPQRKSDLPAYTTILFFLFLPLFCLAFQLYLVFNPPTATVTLVPRSQIVASTGTLQLGRVVPSITLSQSQTVATTGTGHQDATQAQGTITFYNGLFSSQTVSAGTIVTSSQGVQIATDQVANIPAGNPPTYGQVTVSAHVLEPGSRGNIPAYDISQVCCGNAILVKNTASFYGGQNERDYKVVAKGDINGVTSTVKPTLTQSMQGALQGQLKPYEQLQALPCTPTVSTDHRPGEEATQVKVTVSETCSAITYNTKALEVRATQLLTHQALGKLGTGYTMLGTVQVSITQATATHTTTPPVFLSFQAQATWVYALTNSEQTRIKRLITGKSYQAALQLLRALPGIERASLHFDENTKLPKDPKYIHLIIFYGL
jgi:hypothetical protein